MQAVEDFILLYISLPACTVSRPGSGQGVDPESAFLKFRNWFQVKSGYCSARRVALNQSQIVLYVNWSILTSLADTPFPHNLETALVLILYSTVYNKIFVSAF